jgi:hypothetical protein
MIIGMKRIAIILALTLSCQLAPADDWHAALSIMDQSGMRGNDGYEIKAIVARVCGFPILLLYRQTLSNNAIYLPSNAGVKRGQHAISIPLTRLLDGDNFYSSV